MFWYEKGMAMKSQSIGSLLAATALLAGCASDGMNTGGMDGEMAFKAPSGAELMRDEVFPYYDIPNIPISA